MLKPLKEFICDSCSQTIEHIEDGWVEWESRCDETKNKIISKNFRICQHKMKCQKLANHPDCSDLPLREFTGEKAIVQTISFLDDGPYHVQNYDGPEAENIKEFAEFQRRLLLPYYEEARQYWSEAMNDGYFGDSNELSIYLPENLKRMIEHYKDY